MAIPLASFSSTLQEVNAAPSSIRLNTHTCKTFFLGTWDSNTKTCISASNHFYAISSHETLIIPRSVTLIFSDGVVLNLTAGSRLINSGNISFDYSADHLFGCGFTINVQSRAEAINNGNIEPAFNCEGVSLGLFIEEGGSVDNNGLITSAYQWDIVNNGTLNNYGTAKVGLDGRIINYASLYNYGTLNTGDGISRFSTSQLINYSTGTIYNQGTIFVAPLSDLVSYGTIINDGQIIDCGDLFGAGTITGNAVESCRP